ncbi:MAG: hypothetical protein IJL21_00880 [Alphaproteobacteria bacterium]|nr:hypothetical protein [Alphaproteobacteria bacterium]
MIAKADILPLNDALRATYTACVGIDDSLADLKKMAGINTAITGVGTGLGVGATVVGIVKEQKDQAADTLKMEKLRAIEERRIQNETPPTSNEDLDAVSREFDNLWGQNTEDKNKDSEIDKLDRQSKSLGHWRTGLLAGNTATNVAGAIIAGKNTTDGDLQNQIDNCKTAIGELRRARAQARIDGVDVSEANAIVSACEGFETVDISKINTRAKGAMISGIVGATTGLTGTITSAVANSDSVRNQGEGGTRTDKEKNLNTASNVLAGASTVASATATVFNATQIKAIKDVANIAAKCTEALK